MKVSFRLNGRQRTFEVEPGERLRDLLRREGLLTVRNGCDNEGTCGLCAVHLDGRTVNSCLLRVAQVEGHEVQTLEYHNRLHELTELQSAFIDAGVVQCGYCTPAMLLATQELLDREPEPSREQVKDAISGILCRCTGYEQVFDAVELARKRRADPDYRPPEVPEFRQDLRFIGKPHPKVDGVQLVRGAPAFVEDRVPRDALHMKLLRSPFAHARVKRVDASRALELPGVVAVFSRENTPDLPFGQAGQGFPEPSPYDHLMFPRKLRHVGDRVAAVVAETAELAEQALSLIQVDYEPLPPVLSIEEAAREGAPAVHGGPVSYLSGAPEDLEAYNAGADPEDDPLIYPFPIGADPHRNLAASVSGGIGDVERGFAEAEVVIDRTYSGGFVQSTPLEPHEALAYLDESDRLVVRASTQVPWHVRRILSRLLDLPENRIRVIKERTGGAFGAKQDMVIEDLVAWAAWKTGRPVFYRMTREEEFVASRTRHPMEIRVKLGAKRDGTLTAILMELKANTGPYGDHCLTVPMNACSKSLPLLLAPHVHFDVKTYYSNIPPTGAYQGYGAPKGNFALQLAAAELADALGMDLLDFLEKNRVREGVVLEILRSLGEGREGRPQEVYSCGLGEALRRGRELIRWGEREESPDPDVRIGKGVALVQQGSGLPELDSANATLTMFGDGTFMLLSGGTDLGTGLDTVSVKMVAEVLQVPMEAVSIIAADTDVTPFDVGAYASSGTYFSGGAALEAARKMKALVLDVASEMLAEPVDNLRLEYPGAVRGKSGRVTYLDIARYTQSGTGRGQLTVTGTFITDKGSFPYGAHFAQVAVDTRTGKVTVQKYFALQDAGTPINPELALGQLYGGALKTIGHSLTEEMVLDEQGRCLNPTLRDYGVPTVGDLPETFHAELIETDDPFGPFGAKSISEISCNGAAPAIAAAIHDAVGIWLRDWPFTPEKVLRALGQLPPEGGER